MREFKIENEKQRVVETLDLTESDSDNIEKAFNVNIQCLGQELMITDSVKHVVFKSTTMTYVYCKSQWVTI